MSDHPLIALDFETYYSADYSLRKLSIPEYVHDPRFFVQGLAVRYADGTAAFRQDVAALLKELQQQYGQQLEGAWICGHNLMFDYYILYRKYGVRLKYFVDSKYLSYAVFGKKDSTGGSDATLKALANKFGLQPKGDLKFMAGVRESSGAQVIELAEYARHDVELAYQVTERLLPLISRPKVELPLQRHTIRLFTERGIKIDLESLRGLKRQVGEDVDVWFKRADATPEQISGNKTFAVLLGAALARSGRQIPTKPGKNGLIPAVSKKDEAMQRLLDDDDPVVAALAGARLQKKSSDQLISRLDKMEKIAVATGGVLPPYLEYHGAHTGRWSGGGGINLQNFGRDGVGGKIRNLLISSAGNVFVVGDLAQIEARVLAWLAGESSLLDAFRQGADIYSQFASQALGREVRKPREGDDPANRKRLTQDRQIGKACVLGLGYSMGALKFLNTLQTNRELAPLFADATLTPQVCVQLVRFYRKTYPAVSAFWRRLEDAFRTAVQGTACDCGPLALYRDEDAWVHIRLPSGRELRYRDARTEEQFKPIIVLDEDGNQQERELTGQGIVCDRKTNLYGGKLTENVVQAIARDVLAETVLRLEQLGRPVLWHVHDEIILEVPRADADAALETLETELTRVPEWASGLPLACECHAMERYGK